MQFLISFYPPRHFVVVVALIALIISTDALGQVADMSSLRCKWVQPTFGKPIAIDSLSISSSSVSLKGIAPLSLQYLEVIKVSHDLTSNEVLFETENAEALHVDSLLICYRVFPYRFDKPTFIRSQLAYDTGLYNANYHLYKQGKRYASQTGARTTQVREEIFPTGNIKKNGSITRGVSAGNAQDVFVNSALNLQLEGQLTEDINLKAVITDQNVPYQPEGNTQQIQEFDRVYIQLQHKHAQLSAGDVVMKNDPSQFLRYYKNVQGGQVDVWLGDSTVNDVHSTTKAGVAIAKGQFRSEWLEVIEGIQGPYRLTGNNGARFIIVLANSEKVFLDGKPLKRGYNFDYIIDYNNAEITFNNNVVITQFSRIRVDFEYSTQNYSRTITQASHEQKVGKASLGVSFYQEKDDPNTSLTQRLSDADKQLLSQIGDDIDAAIAPAIDTADGYSDSEVLYTTHDTLVEGFRYTFFKVATPEDTAFYRLAFSEVEQGGNYVLGDPNINARTYVWVPPIGGVPQGRYEPVRRLVTPNSRMMATIKAGYQVSRHDKVYGEVALSDQDQNLFSSIDNEDNEGVAFKVGYESKPRTLGQSDWGVGGFADFEQDEENFRAIDRFRSVEFDRDWSVDTDSSAKARDQIVNIGVSLHKKRQRVATYKLTRRDRVSQANGLQHFATFQHRFGRIRAMANGFLMNSQREGSRSAWEKLNADVSYRQRWISPGYIYSMDRNAIYAQGTDSVTRTAMNFDSHTLYLESGDSLKTRYRFDYTAREDRAPKEGQMVSSISSNTYNLSLSEKKKNGDLKINATFRELTNRLLPNAPKEENVTGRLDWNQSFARKAIHSQLRFGTSSGRELKREFVFIKVEPGRGTHTWRDDNGDGIQQIGEFYLAVNPDEKNYAKFFTPTDEYIQAFSPLFNYKLTLVAPARWSKRKGWIKMLSRFSNTASVNANRKTTDDQVLSRLIPFVSIDPEKILSDRSVIRNTLFFNRRNPKYGIEFRSVFNRNKQLLTNGFENRELDNFTLSGRWNISKTHNTKLEISNNSTQNSSDFLENRNYDIISREASPSFSFQPSTNLRLTLEYKYKQKDNRLEVTQADGKSAELHDLGLKARWAKMSKRSMEASVKYVQITFDGESNSAVGYEMLEALSIGTNYNWSLTWNQRIANGLQLNLVYNGRKSEETEIIHFGRVQVTALF